MSICIQYLRKKIELYFAPVELFSALTDFGEKADCLLLESGEPGENHCEKSILIVQSALRIRINQKIIYFEALTENGRVLLNQLDFTTFEVLEKTDSGISLKAPEPSDAFTLEQRLQAKDVFSSLRSLMSQCELADEYSKQAFMLAGLLGYDLIDYFEVIAEEINTSSVDMRIIEDDLYLLIPETRILLDHIYQTAVIEQMVVADGESRNLYHQATSDLAAIELAIRDLEKQNTENKIVEVVQTFDQFLQSNKVRLQHSNKQIMVDRSDAEYEQIVEQAKHYIKKGDVFQVVPSRTFSCDCENSLYHYYCLTQQNPSPYQFYFSSSSFKLFGASPESAVKYSAKTNNVEIYPIAGTAKRGRDSNGNIDFDLDNRLECQLRLDEKELAEHMMLVDLARNDIARISVTASRHVADLLKVDRYSHVMHLVSRVVGQLKPELDAFHAYRACLNMGTLTGAPKIRATQIIRKLEGHKRGYYGGAIGYFDAQGSLDSAIIIRTAIVKDGRALVTAGAGIVADSIAEKESKETLQKASAVLKAIVGNASNDDREFL